LGRDLRDFESDRPESLDQERPLMEMSIGSRMSALQQADLHQQVSNRILRKELDMQQANVQQLLEAVPEPPAAQSAGPVPPGKLDTYA